MREQREINQENKNMRELKFRVWNGHQMIEDVTVGKFGAFYVNPGDKGNGLAPNDAASLTPFTTKYHESAPVMQYTGLKDKNGKEIYEGDLVSFGGSFTGTVKFSEQLACWYIEYQSAPYRGTYTRRFNCTYGDGETYLDETIEVKGNIYENPSLLTP